MNINKKEKTSFSNKKHGDLVRVSIVDVLLDADNHDPIVLEDDTGRELTFEQVAVIPYEKDGELRLYCILHPITPIEGIGEDEAVVFVCDCTEDGEDIIRVEEDEATAVAIFDEYYRLLGK